MTPDLAAVCERIAQEAVALESEAKRVKDAFPLTGRSLDRRAADLRAALAAIREQEAQRDRARAEVRRLEEQIGSASAELLTRHEEAAHWAWMILNEGREPSLLASAPAAEGENE